MAADQVRRDAAHRIESARAQNAKTLDLGDLELPEIPAAIATLKDSLEVLALGAERPVAVGGALKWEHDPKRGMKSWDDLSPLSALAKLKALSLAGCLIGNRLNWLAELTQLRSLKLEPSGLKDLGPLQNLQRLFSLSISGIETINRSRIAGHVPMSKPRRPSIVVNVIIRI